MSDVIDGAMVLVMLSNLALLGSSRLGACIRILAFQGIALGIFALLAHPAQWAGGAGLMAAGSILLRGFAFPWFLSRALREAGVRREVEPFVGYIPSIGIGLLALGFSFPVAKRLPLPGEIESAMALPVALSTILTGLFLIVSRKKALTQVIGYLVIENGIYGLGVLLLGKVPMLVELGVLLDVFVGVFVMSIATWQINREFDHIDVDRLSDLKG